MITGMSNPEIARHLVVGHETVKSHVRAIYRKLAVSSRAAAVSAAVSEGLVT
jgi:DNA-binding NarL/FixJ family response regulator